MSCEITVKSFNPIEIKLGGCNKQDIINLEDAIVCALNQKLDRLSLLTKGCNIYSLDGNLLINDAYNVSSGALLLIETLGFKVKEVGCELKGKSYLVSDELLSTLRNFASNYNFGEKIANATLNETVKDIILKNKFEVDLDYKILDMVLNIKQNGTYVELAKQEVSTDYKDNKFVSEIRGDIISNGDNIKEELANIFKSVQETLINTNDKLKNATASIISYRAKQMGYSIKEVKKGDKIELELVRCD